MPENVLQEADRLTSQDRNRDYGHPRDFFLDVATIWSVLLGVEVKPEQVPALMVAYKLVRTKQGYKRDTWTDVAGYSRTAEMQHDAAVTADEHLPE